MKKLLSALLLLLPSVLFADPTAPAGSYINNSTLSQPASKFNVSTGTIREYLNVQGTTTLSGSYPVRKVVPTSGQVLKYDGSYWSPAADNTGGGGGTAIWVKEGATTVDSSVSSMSFTAADFDVTSSPSGQANISLSTTSTSYIQNRNTLQPGSTFYVQSGNVNSDLTVLGLTTLSSTITANSLTFYPNVVSSSGPYLFISSVSPPTRFGIMVSSRNISAPGSMSGIFFLPGSTATVSIYAGPNDAPLVISTNNVQINTRRELRLGDADNSNYTGFVAPSVMSTNLIWRLPLSDGSGCLSSDGSGNLSITTCGSGGGGSSVNVSPNSVLYSTGGTTISGDTGFQYDSSVSSISLSGDLGIKSSDPNLRITTSGTPNFTNDQIQFFAGPTGSESIASSVGHSGFQSTSLTSQGGLTFKDSSANVIAQFPTNGSSFNYLRTGIHNAGGYSFPIIRRASSFSAAENAYFYSVDATAGNVTMTFPALSASASPTFTNLSYLVCKTDSSSNTVDFAATGDDSINTTITLSNQLDCVVWTSSTSGSVGTWFPTIYSKPNATTGGGSSSIAVGTGTASNFTTNVTSPTAVISFLGSQFRSTASGATNFISIDPSILGSGGSTIYNATSTAGFPFGFSASTATFSENIRVGAPVSLSGLNPRIVTVHNGTEQFVAVSTGSVASNFGAGMIGYVYDTPTASDQRLGFFVLGSANSGGTIGNAVGITGFSEGAWTAGTSHPAYLELATNPSGSSSRSTRLRITAAGTSEFNRNGAVSVSTAIVRVAGSSGHTAPLQTWEGVYNTIVSSISSSGRFHTIADVIASSAQFGTGGKFTILNTGYVNMANGQKMEFPTGKIVDIFTDSTSKMRVITENVLGTSDLNFQGNTGNSTGYTIFESWNGSGGNQGTILGSGNAAANAGPVLIRPNRTTTAVFRSTGNVVLTITSNTANGLEIRGAASQTGNLQEWENSSSVALASVTALGLGYFRNLEATAGGVRASTGVFISTLTFGNGASLLASNGAVVVGTNTFQPSGMVAPSASVFYTDTNTGVVLVYRGTPGPNGSTLNWTMTESAPTSAGDRLGGYIFGSLLNGTSQGQGASIDAFASSAWSVGNTPGFIRLLTTTSGAGTRSEKVRITDAGSLSINEVGSASVSTTTLSIRGSSGHTERLTVWENSAGVDLSSVSANGLGYFKSLEATAGGILASTANITGDALVGTASVNQRVGGNIFTMTASSTSANSTGEINLVATGSGTVTIPSSFWSVGKSLKIKGAGVYGSTTTPGNFTLKIKVGTTVVLTTATVSYVASQVNQLFAFSATLTCRATGASGSLMGQTAFGLYDTTNGFRAIPAVNTSPVSVDLSAARDISFTWQDSSASPGNTKTLTNFSILSE